MVLETGAGARAAGRLHPNLGNQGYTSLGPFSDDNQGCVLAHRVGGGNRRVHGEDARGCDNRRLLAGAFLAQTPRAARRTRVGGGKAAFGSRQRRPTGPRATSRDGHRDPHYQDDHEICVATCRGEVAIKTGTGSPAAAFRGVGGPRNRRRGTGRVGDKETPATGQPRGSVPPPGARRDLNARVFIGNACMGLLAHMRTTSVSKYSVSFGGIQHLQGCRNTGDG